VLKGGWRARANDGGLGFWATGLVNASLSGLADNSHLLNLARVAATTTGTYYIDAFQSRRLSFIGP
jgi:hypothetical protein